MRRLTRLLVLLAVAAACVPAAAAANPYPVTNTADSGEGSLRQAILAANSHMGLDSIPIDVIGTIGLETALPTITDDVAIVGPGAGQVTVRREAALDFRIFDFAPTVTASLSGVTVANGREQAGAGIRNGSGSLTLTGVVVTGNRAVTEGGEQAVVRAGGILSSGPLTLRESHIHDNLVVASNGSKQTVATGGGVETFGALTVERSTVSDNHVEALGEGGQQVVAKGGGLLVLGGPVAIRESTVSGNSILAAEGTSQNVAWGGGVQGSGVELTGSTVTGNSIASDESALGANLQHFATTVVRNSIVSRPLGDATSCNGLIASGGFNIDEDGSCNFAGSGDQEGVNPGLDPVLRANGGATPTHALFENSPALDRGSAFGSAVDQRGLKRPVDLATVANAAGGDGADIGAFEAQGFPPPPPPAVVIIDLKPSDRVPPNTRITRGPARVTFKRLAKFWFTSTEAQSRFQCKVDNQPWRGCRSPAKRKVGPGKHVFRVRAIDGFGNVDPTPARFGWRVKKLGD